MFIFDPKLLVDPDEGSPTLYIRFFLNILTGINI